MVVSSHSSDNRDSITARFIVSRVILNEPSIISRSSLARLPILALSSGLRSFSHFSMTVSSQDLPRIVFLYSISDSSVEIVGRVERTRDSRSWRRESIFSI